MKSARAFTKSQKRQRSTIREEFEWTLSIPTKRPSLMKFGKEKWLKTLMDLNDAYREASDGRDELMNNTMLVFAVYKPQLFAKVSSHPDKLTEEERKEAILLLSVAVKEADNEAR